MAKITLGYWGYRGLAEPIRLLLHYKKLKFEDKRYVSGSGDWPEEKFNLGLDFPNLPYYIDGDVKLTQSTTILRYLAEKYNLDGNTGQEKLQVSLVEQQIEHVRWMLFDMWFRKDFESAKSEFGKDASVQLMLLETYLGDRQFLVGDSVTYVDFLATETIDFYRYFIPDVIKEFPTLKAYRVGIMGLPELQEYLNSPFYKRWPLISPMAQWGGGGEEPERD